MSTDSNISAGFTAVGASVKTLRAGIEYWPIFADSATTFPARSASIPAWWGTRPVAYNSRAYLNHPDPTDMVTGDVHRKRVS